MIVFFTVARLLVPITILRWPLFGVAASIFVDFHDYYYLSQSGFNMSHYQTWDKVMDIYYLSFAAYVALSWKETLAKKIAIFAYLLRLVGVGLEIFFVNEGLLFFFPNFFESFLVFYLLYKKFRRQDLFLSNNVTIIVVLSLLLPKLLQEFSMHLVKAPTTNIIDLSKIPEIGQYFPRPPELWAQSFFYLAIPLGVLFWRLWATRDQATSKTHSPRK